MTENQIKKLHIKYAKGLYKKEILDINWTHSLIVKEIAIQFVDRLKNKGIEVNKDLVEIGALIHDIGIYNCFNKKLNNDSKLSPYICHGLIGYNILLEEGFDIKYARFPLSHTGTGITKEDIKREKLPLPSEDYIPITTEEEIVTFADKFHSKYHQFHSFKEAKMELEKFDSVKGIMMDLFKKKFGIPNLNNLKKEYEEWHYNKNSFLDSIK